MYTESVMATQVQWNGVDENNVDQPLDTSDIVVCLQISEQ